MVWAAPALSGRHFTARLLSAVGAHTTMEMTPHETTEVRMIEVRRTGEGDPLEFEVVVREGNGETRHQVTMAPETCERLTAGAHTPERCLEAAFLFLLDREPKESILARFDVTVIPRYFPEFERELPRYLARP